MDSFRIHPGRGGGSVAARGKKGEKGAGVGDPKETGKLKIKRKVP
jgi:hypothetical protein